MKSRRRVSRFRGRRPPQPTPRFIVGDQAGEFNVLEYLGHSAINPVKLTKLSQEHHWYRVKCSCGNEETHTQQQLIDVRRHRVCQSCIEAIQQIKETT